MQFLQSSCPQCSLALAYNVHSSQSKLLVYMQCLSLFEPSIVLSSSLYTDSVNAVSLFKFLCQELPRLLKLFVGTSCIHAAVGIAIYCACALHGIGVLSGNIGVTNATCILTFLAINVWLSSIITWLCFFSLSIRWLCLAIVGSMAIL